MKRTAHINKKQFQAFARRVRGLAEFSLSEIADELEISSEEAWQREQEAEPEYAKFIYAIADKYKVG